MRLTVPASGLARSASVDMSDLTASTATGDPYWVDDKTVEIPFDPEPSPAEQTLIRRRLLTRDAAHESRVTALLTASQNLGSIDGLAAAVRLLLADALEGIEEVTAPAPAKVAVAKPTPSRNK